VIKRIYIDTSVFGGYFDKEFEDETISFFQRIFEKRITILISEILELELLRAPDSIHDFFEKVVGKSSTADCLHIALATVYKADVLASWNFKHIVNLERIRGYNSINFREGYQMTEIRTPKEIFSYEKDNK
jgi:hypothetical protein